MKICASILAVIFLSFLFFENVNAQGFDKYYSNGDHFKVGKREAFVSSEKIENGKITSVKKENPVEAVRLIVTFKDKPLAVYVQKRSSLQKSSLLSVYAALQSGHESFRTALNTIRLQLSTQLKSDYGYTIKRDYYRALNGVALECKRGMIDKIRALPMVKHVYTDEEVKCNLEQSVHQIRADIVQDSLGITGKGVLVGDIDTGIDYNNPALGGGFGPAFRVIGGYDFVNNDSDPMDDMGHGTHVAGIIGANGDSLRGVAPDVKFLAVKVLNAQGQGYISDVIAGIDYCLDPDNNPATNDGVSLINMSLGGAPYPDNPLDSAVNNADKAGVLSVVAAGNNSHGPNWWGTIGSPGTSETALTVGACDSSFNIAWFSSAGPDPLHSAIKPEVVAPGVNILSTVLHNKTERWSGTSMATPHVTGVAALLKQEHPSWTPEEIKAAIVNTAHSVGENVPLFVQGKGCVDALDAAEAKTIVEPGVLSFGTVDLAQDVWADTIEIKVKNIYSNAQTLEILVKDGIPTGATLAFDKTKFTLAPGEETTVVAILSVPSSFPIVNTEPFAYTGNIEVVSEFDSVIVPFSFIKSSTIVVNFEKQPQFLWVINRKGGIIKGVSSFEGVTQYKIPVSSINSLELLAGMRQDTLGATYYYIVDRKIDDPAGLTYVFLSTKEATISLADSTIQDADNNTIAIDSTSYINLEFELVVSGSNASSSYAYTWGFPYDRFRIFSCPLDSTYYIYKWMVTPHGDDYFDLRKYFWGIKDQKDINFPTGKDNLHGYNVALSYDDPYLNDLSSRVKSIAFGTYDISEQYEVGTGVALSITSGGNPFPVTSNKVKVFYNDYDINPAKVESSGDYHYSYRNIFMVFQLVSYVQNFEWTPVFSTPNFVVKKSGEAVFGEVPSWFSSAPPFPFDFSPQYIYEVLEPGDTVNLQQYNQVCFPFYISYLNKGSVFISGNDKLTNSFLEFPDGLGRPNGVYELLNNHTHSWTKPRFTANAYADNKLQIDTAPSAINNPVVYYKYDNLKNNTLRLITSGHQYKILGQGGQSTIDCEYKIPENSTGTTYCPSIDLIQVSVDGKAVDVVHPGQNGIVRLILDRRDSTIASVDLSVLLPSGEEIILPTTEIGNNEYNAAIPGYLPEGFIDVVARIEDAQGNKSELTASPAFYFGNSTDNISFDALVRMSSYKLDNAQSIQFAIGDTLLYTLTYTNYGNVTARNVKLQFPSTPYFKPLDSQSIILDSIGIIDTLKIAVKLVYLGSQQSNDEITYYSPTISWTSGETNYLRVNKILVDLQNTVTGITQASSKLPSKFELFQNYPNPFNPNTTIRFDLPKESRVKITVYDILGRQVTTLVNEMKKAGSYTINWNAGRLASGVYFYRLQTDDYVTTKKLLLLK